ncbi:MAG: hypothetical protein ACQEVA_14825 [Myxococcota bacterium]
MRDDDLLMGARPRQRRVEPVAFDGDPPQLRKHEQGIMHTIGLVAMCAPFVCFALHVEKPAPDDTPPAPPEPPRVAATAVPSMPASSEELDASPSYFDQNAEPRVVLRRILFVPTEDPHDSEKMDVLYDVDARKNTVELEQGEAIRGSVERD